MRDITIGPARVREGRETFEADQRYTVDDELAAKFCALGWASADDDPARLEAAPETDVHEIEPHDAGQGMEG